MMKHQFLKLPPSLNRREASLPAASSRLPTPGIGARKGRGFLPEGSNQILELSEVEARSLPATRPVMGRADAVWQSVLRFLMEGFALYGASVHWVATTAVTTIANEVDAWQRQMPALSEPRTPSTRDGFASPVREADRYRLVHPGWPAMISRAIARSWAKWRRAREIRKAMAALAEHDDRMLRDMGIPHRSQIEQVLRYGRDN
jgi:uncharacterized protein YjiS (DUF1127 family)